MLLYWLLLAILPTIGELGLTRLKIGIGVAMTLKINITPNGRMSLPADVRKRLGLIGGGAIYLDETDDGVVLRTANQAVARAQALAKQYTGGNPDASVDAFLNRRREDSGE
jgi:AbrB family looped-hinge helix DNA binding protein